MKNIIRPLLLIALLISLTGCDSMPKLFWSTDEGTGRPDYRSGGDVPLDVPPVLTETASSDTSQMPDGYSQAVAGKAVAVHARQYNADARHLFSAVEKAMLSLNIPVTSSDLQGGVVISEWIKKVLESPGLLAGLTGDSSPRATRHRYIVRVFRLEGEQQKSRLEVRTLHQEYRGHWVNSRNHDTDDVNLFGEIERQLALL
ncbi:hypothetical protein Ga0123462_2184 [Mariprofundus ferrinatatus]|uniref:Outer membrane protein assembly factor BamC n=1 Tax=Mariprofundus ferrinatatus TaxID=1921087 RepID=A0A2K8L6T0_9PROT|nr:hypothetical protein [Mariprofundus ferrinatatus]ATX83018.1 hypothetical protein Ga0123462_2184 [Mariprofundus ferrinatatus]